MPNNETAPDPVIDVKNFTFNYGGPDIVKDLSLEVNPGERILIVGANGAGKTTLLRILAGKRKIEGHVRVFSRHAFVDAPAGVLYLGTDWAHNPHIRSDMSVDFYLSSMGSKRWPERTKRLLEVLEVDLSWRLHQCSDGQLRRVQLTMGLLQPWNLLLLDEVTMDLDILVRTELLKFLREETETRGATIVYTTHIFDGLSSWMSHVVRMADGAVLAKYDINDFPEYDAVKKYHREHGMMDSPLMALCYKWIKEDHRRGGDQAKRQVEPETGLPHSKWDDLKGDMKQFGDKYYNYWN
ncbi:P-loop containing nucleoside triphosphate hydrolase protein [Zychaea mexicana]|uniref:P-loop containing nucleoside triphosphate hydrolase protein n=1 Tax=Zychaea mexicana TaxID=64656 RepID=UPI0022FDC254|nr:P-loop containing nucleoside triphosphate hydrolase protein [Zychaea mexicana]KAI9495144.1 P-loop containing nucleoside triphosphate hydrolase protein [Zychaea mexicana]